MPQPNVNLHLNLQCNALIIPILILAFICIKSLFNETESAIEGDCGKKLVIGVISARDHFLQREAIRATWGANIPEDMKLLFVVGDSDCPYHPQDRISKYGCQKWDIQNIDTKTHFFHRKVLSHNDDGKSNHWHPHECLTSIAFRILHPVVLDRVSVRLDIIKSITNSTIILKDAEEILETIAVTGAMCSEAEGDASHCVVKLASPLLLPTGFEGELSLQENTKSQINLCEQFFSTQGNNTKNEECIWDNQSVVQYTYVRDNNGVISHWRNKSCPIISAHYHIFEQESLLKHKNMQSERQQEWKIHTEWVSNQLQKEDQEFGDIFYVPRMDVYHNLPQKVLAFLNWVTLSYCTAHILKVDDDVSVNLLKVKELIDPPPPPDASIWWSHFHYQRSVPVMGKWADPHYPGIAYPYFPSGSGYLLTNTLAESISDAHDHLDRSWTGRGEDVSMGIWVAALMPHTQRVHLPCWLPNSGCSYSVITPKLEAIKTRLDTHHGKSESTLPKQEL